jgi:exopolyphosphatase / guanosine-5'-triphosphate,3'-diphosphate pyrophosphatase
VGRGTPNGGGAVTDSDLAVVSGQLGRTARDVTGIAVRCPFGRPAVIETSPVLAGEPNPTLLYLTCPSGAAVISRDESAGGVRRLKSACEADPELRRALEEVTLAYRRRRAWLAPGGEVRPEAGIGGPGGPGRASCLHAYAAALLAALEGWLDEDGAPGDEALDPAGVAARAWDRFLPPRSALWCLDDRCAQWTSGGAAPRVAAIDVGTISVRLLVAQSGPGGPQEILRRVEVTRLGEGLRTGEPLGVAAAARTGAVVGRYVEEARRLGAGRVLIAGTSATRDAVDGAAFIRRLGEENAADSVVLSGAQEAALAYAGASLDIEGDLVVLDIGGGSTELIRRAADGEIEAVSLDLGASRASELWMGSDPPTEDELETVRAEAAAIFQPQQGSFGAGNGRLVGVAGTVTTLACLDTGLQIYDPQVIHLRGLSLPSVDRLVARLAAMTTAERAALPCVQVGRAPVIVGGAVIVQTAMKILGYAGFTVSERDLLDGLALAVLSGRLPGA